MHCVPSPDRLRIAYSQCTLLFMSHLTVNQIAFFKIEISQHASTALLGVPFQGNVLKLLLSYLVTKAIIRVFFSVPDTLIELYFHLTACRRRTSNYPLL